MSRKPKPVAPEPAQPPPEPVERPHPVKVKTTLLQYGRWEPTPDARPRPHARELPEPPPFVITVQDIADMIEADRRGRKSPRLSLTFLRPLS